MPSASGYSRALVTHARPTCPTSTRTRSSTATSRPPAARSELACSRSLRTSRPELVSQRRSESSDDCADQQVIPAPRPALTSVDCLGTRALGAVARRACCAAAVQEAAETGVAECGQHRPGQRDTHLAVHGFPGSELARVTGGKRADGAPDYVGKTVPSCRTTLYRDSIAADESSAPSTLASAAQVRSARYRGTSMHQG